MSIETVETVAPVAAPAKPNYRCPDAKLILPANAPQEDWLRVRREGIGGSDVSALVGLGKYPGASPYGVWLEKTGNSKRGDISGNPAVRWGKLLEPALKQAFSEDTGLKVKAAGLMRSKAHPFMQVTVDGLTEDGGIFESKTTTGWLAHEWEDDQIPDHAELQVQHGMAVTGRSHAWVVGLIFDGGRTFHVRRVERNEELIAELIAIEEQFWQTNVLQGIEPGLLANDLGTMKDTFSWTVEKKQVEVDRELAMTLKERITSAKELIKAGEATKDQAEAELRMLMGDAEELLVDGKVFATLKQNSTFGEKRFKEGEPELAKELVTTKEVLDIDRLKAEHPDTYKYFRARALRFNGKFE